MVHISNRNIQVMNTFLSSWTVFFLAIGIIMKEWVILISENKKIKKIHSPWMVCCTTLWPEDNLKVIRIMMISALGFSFFLNLMQGLKLTYMIPQNKLVHVIAVILNFLSGTLLLCALLQYYHKLKQGQSVYFASYKITWITFTAFLNVFILFVCGILSVLECMQFTKSCSCLNIHKSANDCKESSLPECTTIPHSIVHVYPTNSKKDTPNKQVQTHHVTWTL
ncbi:transmembrane protein 225 [Carlito syrichta]|uniref:Transmembrane protein 225 n=1 Tax=Carlito syrichta TaxID=1868482 RepID=A0A1U7UGK9_CARSF|nr:transmembrane protein 225 [Carlito syrichta]